MKYVTFLNYGCVEICENMLISAQKVGISMNDFYIGCIDKKSYDYMKKYSNCFLHNDQSNVNYEKFGSIKFNNIMKIKQDIIKKFYETNKNFCYLDTDIVFLNNPTDYMKDKEYVLFQNDEPGNPLCAGFVVYNNIKRCEDFINDEEIKNLIEKNIPDQDAINQIADKKYRDCVATLPKEKFPNGYNYFTKNISNEPFIVHNNFIVGIEKKINRFKQNNLWFLN